MTANKRVPISVEELPPGAPFLTARQVAEYLHLNEKKVYGLVNEGRLPGTKITGKWLFPRELVDKWLMETSHGGVFNDRLVVAGSDDPLVYRTLDGMTRRLHGHALVNHSSTGIRLGLELLASGRADVCMINWGPAEESHLRHPALLRDFPTHTSWVVVRAFQREQGLMLAPNSSARLPELPLEDLLARPALRWVFNDDDSGSQRFLREAAASSAMSLDRLSVVERTVSEREALSRLLRGEADIAPGARANAAEFGLDFISFGWEAFDLVLTRATYFRRLFQEVIEEIGGQASRRLAERFGGYDLSSNGRLIWSA